MNGNDAQFYQDLATRDVARDEMASHSTIGADESGLQEGMDNTSLKDLANAATTKTDLLLGKFSIGQGDTHDNADLKASKPAAIQHTVQRKATGSKDKREGTKDTSSRDQRRGGNSISVASTSASSSRKFLSAKLRPRKITTFVDYGNRLRMNIVYGRPRLMSLALTCGY